MINFSYAADMFQSINDFSLLFFLLVFLDGFGASLSFEIEVHLLGCLEVFFLCNQHVVTLMMINFRFRRQFLHPHFRHGLRPQRRLFRASRSLLHKIFVNLRNISTRYFITVIVFVGILDQRTLLTALFLNRVIESSFTSSDRRPLFPDGTRTINPRLKNLDHLAHFLIIILLFSDLDIGHFVGARSKLASCIHVGQSVGLVHILNKLKRSIVEYIFYAWLLIERVIRIDCHIFIVVNSHLILNIDIF